MTDNNTMKKIFFIILLNLCFCLSGLFGLSLLNNDDQNLYFLVYNKKEANAASSAQNYFSNLLSWSRPKLISIASGCGWQLADLSQEDGLAFFYLPPSKQGAEEVLLFLFENPRNQKVLNISRDFDPNQCSAVVALNQEKLPPFTEAVKIDGEIIDWQNYPSLFNFPGFRKQALFFREESGERTFLEEDKISSDYKENLPEITQVKAVLLDQSCFIMISLSRDLKEDESFFFYFYPSSKQNNTALFEANPNFSPQVYTLWTAANPQVTISGFIKGKNQVYELQIQHPYFIETKPGSFLEISLAKAQKKQGLYLERLYSKLPLYYINNDGGAAQLEKMNTDKVSPQASPTPLKDKEKPADENTEKFYNSEKSKNESLMEKY